MSRRQTIKRNLRGAAASLPPTRYGGKENARKGDGGFSLPLPSGVKGMTIAPTLPKQKKRKRVDPATLY